MALAREVDLRPEDLAGHTWAGYIRESTAGQADRYGPHLQREEQRRFGERYGLVATGREYVDLVSGKDTLRRTDFARMLADAEAGAFDVLLCYDTSRFARNVADAWAYRDRLAKLGVVVVFCADGLISGNVDTYELEGLKTVSDEAYIRRLSRNVSRGYEQKWRLYGDPGGHAPLGFARLGERQLLAPVEGPDLDRARRAFELYAGGTRSDAAIADELGLTEAGVAEILTNPLYAGRAVRHKGRPDEEEKPTSFPAPVDPELFARVQAMRTERRTRHPGGTLRRVYPTVRLMRCVRCESTYYGDANNGKRRIRHRERHACSPSASHRAEVYEEQIARLMDRVELTDQDIGQILAAMRQVVPVPDAPDAEALVSVRAELQRRLAAGELGLDAFSREWRRLDQPRVLEQRPDELRLRRAHQALADFGALWRNPNVPDGLREEALREIFERFDIAGQEVVAAHPRPNENAWLLGYAAMRDGSLTTQQEVGLVGARGLAPTNRISDYSPPRSEMNSVGVRTGTWRASEVRCTSPETRTARSPAARATR